MLRQHAIGHYYITSWLFVPEQIDIRENTYRLLAAAVTLMLALVGTKGTKRFRARLHLSAFVFTGLLFVGFVLRFRS